jgi:uncharacterized protein (TIGR04562 family)
MLDIVVGGKSSLDSTQGLGLRSREIADRFIASYGYDLEDPIERAEAFGTFHEALNFIRRFFLKPDNPEGLNLEVPRKILELTDVRDLFVWASAINATYEAKQLGLWSCAILKVMHPLAHMEQDLRVPYFAEVQKQILDRYYKQIHRDGQNRLYLGERDDDPARVDLVAFETKPKKSRDSTLLKLLHKSESVAEEVFDRVGIRFVTHDILGTLRVVKFLADRMIVIPPNLKPSRSRNTLVDLEDFRRIYTEGLAKYDQGAVDEVELISIVQKAAHELKEDGPENKHSSRYYRSIQFTARQLIKLRNPLFDDLKELRNVVRQMPGAPGEVSKIIERMDLKHLPRAPRFFYPYEVQIVDQISQVENERGRSAHSEYKKAQVATAMKRVMGPLAEAK